MIPEKIVGSALQGQNGWTPGGYGIWVLVLMGFGYIVRQYVPWFKANTERETSASATLQALVDRLQVRIDNLEKELSVERKRADEEIAVLRTQHIDEVRGLNEKIDALQRIIIQWQVSTGRMLEMPPGSKSAEALERLQVRLNDIKGTDE